ncbi:DUF1648 domain-containing protein [Pseudonocardia dioxanivorans]|uniref:DUF1648 domain-containing protein n=1 Tax=Pseudonocardia dioxanivorans TaxID=240495 RepID=UPI000CD2F8D4|nr:DUF1648 domain-containing protein [Pseudonocardia dioxanivorans]
MGRTTGAILTGAPHLVAVLPAVVTTLVAWDRLPAEMASRFAADGTVVDTMPRAAMLVAAILLGVVMSAVFAAIGGRSPAAPVSSVDTMRFFGLVSWATAGILGTVLLSAVLANVDAPDAAAAELPMSRLLVALAVAAVAGAVGYLVTPRSPVAPPQPAAEAIAVAPGELVSWSGRVESRASLALGAVLVVAGLAAAWPAGPLVGALLVAVGLAVLLLGSSALVTVDRRGLVVSLGVLGWPRLRIPADDIASVTTGDVSPAQFGGWGYRIVPGGSGVVLRRGPALIVTRRSGRRFTVTVDDARTAAGLLVGLGHRVS